MANAWTRIGWSLLALTLSVSAALSDEPPEQPADQKTAGQEYQREIDAAVWSDGSWAAAWIDYRLGHPALYARSFDANDVPGGPGVALTDGLGLFRDNLNAYPIGDPVLAPLEMPRSLLVWREQRGGVDRVRAVILSGTEIDAGPVTINDEDRMNTRTDPDVAVSGNRVLVTWTEGGGAFSKVYAQILTDDLSLIDDNFRIHSETPTGHRAGRILPAPDGWIVAWQEYTGGVIEQVLLRRVSLSGSFATNPIHVDTRPDWDQGEPALESVNNGLFVSWIASSQGNVNLFGRMFDHALDPVADAFLVVDEGATVTPREPKVVSATDTSVLVVWTAGPASRSRFHARQVLLPDEPTGSFLVVDDPDPPVGSVLVPREMSLRGGATTPRRLLWHDARDGWDLVYQMHLDVSGAPLTSPTAVELAEGTASQVLPCIAQFSDGGGVSAWGDFRTGSLTIYATMLGMGGAPEQVAFRISETTGGSVAVPAMNLLDLLRNRPSAAALADGRAVIAWTTILPGGNTRVYMQLIEPSGELLGNNTVLPVDGFLQDRQSQPQVAAQPDSTYFVVWQDTADDDAGDILAHRFLSDGTPIGDTIRVVDVRYQGASQTKPSIAASGTGEVVITWIDDRRGGSYDVYTQRLGPTGQKILSNTLISGPEVDPIPQTNPAVAAAPDRYVVVWDENSLGRGNISGLLVTLPTSKEGGQAVEEQISFTIDNGARGFMYPSVSMAPNGRFVVTYWDTSDDQAQMISQRFDTDAVVLGPSYSLASIDGEASAIPGGVAAKSDSILYAWSDSRDGNGWTAMVRKLSWHFGGITAVSTTSWSVTAEDRELVLRWSVPISRAGSLFRVWRARADRTVPGSSPGPDAVLAFPGAVGPERPGGTDYLFRDATAEPGVPVAYWIEDQTGDFGGPWTGILNGDSRTLSLHAIDNPFTESLRLTWSAPAGDVASLGIYDAAGRCLRSMHEIAPAGGIGEWTWDGRDETGRASPAGIYWIRLHAERIGERSVKVLRLR